MKIDVLHIAKLANLTLKSGEIEKYEKQLSSILEFIESLSKVNTENIAETSQTTGLENVTSQDIAAPSLTADQALSNTKSQHNGFFKVKGVLSNE